MRLVLSLAGFLLLAAALVPVNARANGDEVVVIYNSRVPESKALADYYATRREVPRAQIFGFDLTTNEIMSRTEFRDTLEKPLVEKLENTKLWRFGSSTYTDTNGQTIKMENKLLESGIRYAVLCYGVPLKIQRDSELKESGEEALRQEFRRNEAAVDSELACLPWIKQPHLIAGPLRNAHYTSTNEAAFHPTNGVLMVTRLDGPTPEIARGLVDKAIKAETEGLWGRAYFDLRFPAEPGLKQGDSWIGAAAEMCHVLGFETTVDTNGYTFPASFPMSHIAYYCGWYDPDVSGPFALPNVEFMPGAFAYHLHSFSAASIRTTAAHWVGPLLAKGATITMGSVEEPYIGGTPDVGVFTARLLFYKFTFGEAAYASQNALSWQTTVVGDPLYRPFAKSPPLLHLELERAHDKRIEWSSLRVVNLNAVKGATVAQRISFLEQIDTTKQSAVLSEKLGDLCAAAGKPSSTIYAYEQALKLDPSPQQRIRIRLTLGDKLIAAGRDKDAYDNYQKLMEESPAYPGKLSVSEKLATLARKLEKPVEAMQWEEQIKRLTPFPTPAPTTPAAIDTNAPIFQPVPPRQPLKIVSPITPAITPITTPKPPTNW